MTDFDALLKRSFAEAHEPADDGFAVNVAHAVAQARSRPEAAQLHPDTARSSIGAAASRGASTTFAGAFGQNSWPRPASKSRACMAR